MVRPRTRKNRRSCGPSNKDLPRVDEVLKMATVHVLFHTTETELDDQDRLVAVSTDREEAESVLELLRSKSGFRESPNGWVIDEYVLDEDNWTGGFAGPDDDACKVEPACLVDTLAIDPNPDVFVLIHRRVIGMHEDMRLIGVYSSDSAANVAAHRTSKRPGFRSFPQGFVVLGLTLKVVHWRDGFDVADASRHRLLSLALPTHSPK